MLKAVSFFYNRQILNVDGNFLKQTASFYGQKDRYMTSSRVDLFPFFISVGLSFSLSNEPRGLKDIMTMLRRNLSVMRGQMHENLAGLILLYRAANCGDFVLIPS